MISLIAAMTQNNVIGKNNELPWHVPEDFEWFKEKTAGKPVLMGRKTHESIGRVLKGRDNIVITNNKSYKPLSDIVKVFHSLDDALKQYINQPELMIIGGQQIYEQALPHASRVYLTIFNTNLEGDAFFPNVDEASWNKVYTRKGKTDTPFEYTFNIFERI